MTTRSHWMVVFLTMTFAWSANSSFAQHEPGDSANKLFEAVTRGKVESAKKLIESGADVNSRNEAGLSSVHLARLHDQQHVAEVLLAKGAKDSEMPELSPYIDSILSELASPKEPGVAVLVSRGGKILFNKCYGMACLTNDVPVTPKTKFRIGSVTKQFVAAAILKLQEDGKLSVSDTLAKFMPDFPRGQEVTLHHLLTHTSGMVNVTSIPDFYTSISQPTSTDKVIALFKNDPFIFSPGQKHSYCNSGYILLGAIIEQVSGATLDTYLQKTFFQPLKMHNTGIHDGRQILKQEASGYAFINDHFQNAMNWHMSRAGGAGALYSTVEDLHHWNEAIFSGKALNQESLDAAFKPVETKEGRANYGYGFALTRHRGLKRINHSGGLHGFLSTLLRYPEQDLTVAVLHNSSPPNPKLVPDKIAVRLSEFYLWKEMKPATRYQVAEDVDSKTYDALVGRYDYGAALLVVTRETDRLFAQLTGQPRHEIFPASKTKFFWKVVDAQVEFLIDDQGKVTAAQHTQNGRTFKAPRIEDRKIVQLDDGLLEKYVGNYEFRSIGTMKVTRKENQLYIQLGNQPALEVYPTSATRFFYRAVKAEIEFRKDNDDNSTGLTLLQHGKKFEAKRTN